MSARFRGLVTQVAVFCSASVTALAQDGLKPTLIVGTLLGAHDEPLKVAHVWLRLPHDRFPFAESTVGRDGRFAIATTATGAFLLGASGVDHLRALVPLVIDRPKTITLDVRLLPYTYTDSLDRVVAIGDWNKFDFASGRPLVKQPDGRYTLEVETTEDTLAYQLVGLTSEHYGYGLRWVNGTEGIRYIFDGEDYESVIKAERGRATIMFDPRLLDRRPGELRVAFQNARSREAGIFETYSAVETWIGAYFDTLGVAGGRKDSVHFDWASAERDLAERRSRERDPLARELLSLSLLRIGVLGAKLDSGMARGLIRELPPTSVWWSFHPSYVSSGTRLAFRRAADPVAEAADLAKDTARVRELGGYLEQVVAGHDDPDVRARALGAMMQLYRDLKDERRANQVFVRLVSEYPNAPNVGALKVQFSSNRVLRVGNAVPDFRFVAIGDSNVSYTPESLKGRVYLLDFWATWCGPCLQQMPYLQKAYDRFKSKGLEILSVSLDVRPDDVTRFRAGEWKMPWLHAFASGGFHNPVMKQFDIVFIPRGALVGRDGRIVAVDEELRGERLVPTIEQRLP